MELNSDDYSPELITARESGLLRRLMNIDFVQSFIGSQRDPYLKRKLAEPDALSGFLSLIVDALSFGIETVSRIQRNETSHS